MLTKQNIKDIISKTSDLKSTELFHPHNYYQWKTDYSNSNIEGMNKHEQFWLGFYSNECQQLVWRKQAGDYNLFMSNFADALLYSIIFMKDVSDSTKRWAQKVKSAGEWRLYEYSLNPITQVERIILNHNKEKYNAKKELR